MDSIIDHYSILGLPSGIEGTKLVLGDISNAYKRKALESHPDKKRDDPRANEKFQEIKSSYEILKDEKARKLFDDLLRLRHERHARQSRLDSKRSKMMSDLERREQSSTHDTGLKVREEEERIARKLEEETARIHAMHARKMQHTDVFFDVGLSTPMKRRSTPLRDAEKMVRVSWEKTGEDYSVERLRELFSTFGEVEDIVVSSSKRKRSALVVMSTTDGAVSSLQNAFGSLSNPLLVLPLQEPSGVGPGKLKRAMDSVVADKFVGSSFKSYEDSVLEKLQKRAAENKS